jgi:hypothetical protein
VLYSVPRGRGCSAGVRSRWSHVAQLAREASSELRFSAVEGTCAQGRRNRSPTPRHSPPRPPAQGPKPFHLSRRMPLHLWQPERASPREAPPAAVPRLHRARWEATTNAASRPTTSQHHAANTQRGTRPMASGRARQTPTSRASNSPFQAPPSRSRRGSNGDQPSLVSQIHSCVRSRDCQREASGLFRPPAWAWADFVDLWKFVCVAVSLQSPHAHVTRCPFVAPLSHASLHTHALP